MHSYDWRETDFHRSMHWTGGIKCPSSFPDARNTAITCPSTTLDPSPLPSPFAFSPLEGKKIQRPNPNAWAVCVPSSSPSTHPKPHRCFFARAPFPLSLRHPFFDPPPKKACRVFDEITRPSSHCPPSRGCRPTSHLRSMTTTTTWRPSSRRRWWILSISKSP